MEDYIVYFREISVIVASLVGIFSFIKGYFEYRSFNRLKRVEFYMSLRHKFKENDTIQKISEIIENNDEEKIENISSIDKYTYLGFFEDIALLVNSKLIKPEIAHYMFGYYAIKCSKNTIFMKEIEDKSMYWIEFYRFVKKMNDLEKRNMTIIKNEKKKFKI
ncbi:MAG: hypothetical protein JXR48_01425 [Candidatus Delongbacteria bacterium]|nr:hypothetical protein [Candidatus Delongbacteria bacterium]